MPRYGLLIDIKKCNGCYNCFLACKDEHCGSAHLPVAAAQPELGHFWMNVVEKERGSYPKVKVASIPLTCMQCDDPAPCVAAAEAAGAPGAVYRRSDGVIIIDPEKARGLREVVGACPHGAVFWNEAAELPQKCTMCAHLLEQGWKEPRCVEACPTGALVFGDWDDPAGELAQLAGPDEVEELRPGIAARGAVKYLSLPKRFVAATVYLRDAPAAGAAGAETGAAGPSGECATDCEVVLVGPGLERRAHTNFFGDFEFEDLPADADFEVVISRTGFTSRRLRARTATDVYFGEVYLERG
jgi:Fe-S-cluster-containing dehydrogenase component